MVRIPGFHCHGLGSIPGRGTEIPQSVQRGQKKKEEQGVEMQSWEGRRQHGQAWLRS